MGNRSPNRILNEGDLKALSTLTGMDVYTIQGLHTEFSRYASKKGAMSKRQFREAYANLIKGEMRCSEATKRKADQTFKAFDGDQSGDLTFNEFMTVYVMLRGKEENRKKVHFLLSQIEGKSTPSESINRAKAKQILNSIDQGYSVNRAQDAFQTMLQNSGNANDIPTKVFIDVVIDPSNYGKVIQTMSPCPITTSTL
ncbi:hypothetical protein ACOME3_005167 [Neoechinorhynchus agilis]